MVRTTLCILGGTMFYIGVDGGGTKTAFSLIDKNGMEVASVEKETCHFAQVGISGFRSVFKEGTEELLSKADLSLEDITYLFFGIPGYGEILEKDKEMKIVLSQLFPKKNFTCGNDVEASWAGSLACKPGISIVAGTGAIAYGKNSHNSTARCSGWGDFCGDEGSAYWIAKKGIEVFTKQADYRYERGALYDVFSSKLTLQKSFDLLDLVTVKYEQSRTKVAQLSKLVYEAAVLGDRSAIGIFHQAAEEHFLMIKGIASQLEFHEDKIPVSYTGGVFQSGDLILKPLKKAIEDAGLKCHLIDPILSPVRGSALYAMVLAGNEIDIKIINNLKI